VVSSDQPESRNESQVTSPLFNLAKVNSDTGIRLIIPAKVLPGLNSWAEVKEPTRRMSGQLSQRLVPHAHKGNNGITVARRIASGLKFFSCHIGARSR